MSTFKKTICCLTLLTVFQAACTLTASGQDSQQYDFSTISINGLELDRYYNRERIINALGKPDGEGGAVYYHWMYHSGRHTTVGGTAKSAAPEIYIPKDSFGFASRNDSLMICVFTLNTDRFAVNDYVRVGDPVSKVYDMGGKTLEDRERSRIYWAPEGSPDEPWIEWDCYPTFWYDGNGIITMIELYYD